MLLTVYSDGACTPNPGPMGIGFIILDGSEVVYSCSEDLGEVGTNNMAEYLAIDTALAVISTFEAHHLKSVTLDCYSDSKLAVEQLNGNWSINEKHLQALCIRIRKRCTAFKKVTFTHVKRSHPWIVEVDRQLRLTMEGS